MAKKSKAKHKSAVKKPAKKRTRPAVPVIVPADLTVRVADKSNLLRLSSFDPKYYVIHAYKVIQGSVRDVIKGRGKPPLKNYKNPELRYKLGGTVEEVDADRNILRDCGPGLHVATKEWCHEFWPLEGVRKRKKLGLYIVEVSPQDIACVPLKPQYIGGELLYKTVGKFRVSKLRVLKRVPWDKPTPNLEPPNK